MTDLNKTTQVTEEEINATPRLKAINEAVKTLVDLCKPEPMASIILSIIVPNESTNPDDENEGSIVSIYSGDTISHINQFDLFAQSESDFLRDLMIFLDIRINRQMKAEGTTGNNMVDQLLATMNSDGNEIIN